MSLPVVVLLVTLVAIGLLLTVATPWWGLELGFGLGAGLLGAAGALVSGVAGAIGGVFVAVFAVGFALLAAAGAVLLAIVAVPLVLLAVMVGLVFGLAPLWLPVVLLVGLVWLLARASRGSPPPALPGPAAAR